MEKNYKEIIEDLEESIKDIESKGISIKPLNDSLDELKKHSDNIERIEANIDAIREEVIDRIKDELDENKTAGKFSIFGFWIGAIALLLTTIQIWREITKTPDINSIVKESTTLEDKINRIDKNLTSLNLQLLGFDDNYIPDSTEILAIYCDPLLKTILKSGNNKIQININKVDEKEVNKKLVPFTTLSFYINDKKLGLPGLKESVAVTDVSGTVKYDTYRQGYELSEGDIITLLGKYKFIVKRIYRKESNILKIADDKDAVLLDVIK